MRHLEAHIRAALRQSPWLGSWRVRRFAPTPCPVGGYTPEHLTLVPTGRQEELRVHYGVFWASGLDMALVNYTEDRLVGRLTPDVPPTAAACEVVSMLLDESDRWRASGWAP